MNEMTVLSSAHCNCIQRASWLLHLSNLACGSAQLIAHKHGFQRFQNAAGTQEPDCIESARLSCSGQQPHLVSQPRSSNVLCSQRCLSHQSAANEGASVQPLGPCCTRGLSTCLLRYVALSSIVSYGISVQVQETFARATCATVCSRIQQLTQRV